MRNFPSVTAGYDGASRARLSVADAPKDDGEMTSKSAQEKLDEHLEEMGIQKIIIADEDHEHNRLSSLSLGNKSYILDLAHQKENREKDLKEEALENALELYKTAMEAGSPESDKLFLMIFIEVQKELEESHQDHYRKQEERLEEALQDELKIRQEEQASQDELKTRQEEGATEDEPSSEFTDQRDSVQVSACTDKEKEGRSTNGRFSMMENIEIAVSPVMDEGGDSDVSISSVDLNLGDQDLEKGQVDLEKGQVDQEKKEKSGWLASLFGKRKREYAEDKQDQDGDEKPAPGSEVFRELEQMQQQGTADETMTSTPDSVKKSKPDLPQVTVNGDDTKSIDLEVGSTNEERKQQENFIKLLSIGIALFLLFDAVMLIIFLVNRSD
jgi:hypothetical protein